MQRNAGVTLIELGMVLLITVVLVCMAVPAYQGFVQQRRTQAALQQLVSALRATRVQALARRYVVALCPSADGDKCGRDWRLGMLLFVDKRGDGFYDPNMDQRIKIYPAFSPYISIRWNRSKAVIQMAPQGRLKSQNGTFDLCNARANFTQCYAVILSHTGRVRVENP